MPVTDLNALVGATLKGEYKKRGMRLEDIAKSAGIPYPTLRKKIAGQSPIFATELILICQVIGVTPERVLGDAMDMYGGVDKLVSEVTSTTEAPDKRRKQAEALSMTTEQIEDLTAIDVPHIEHGSNTHTST